MTTKLGTSGSETTINDPLRDGYESELLPIAGSVRTLDGTLRFDITAMKRYWRVPIVCTSAELTTLNGLLDDLTTQSWMPPEGGTYTVRVVTSKHATFGATHYRVDFELEEV